MEKVEFEKLKKEDYDELVKELEGYRKPLPDPVAEVLGDGAGRLNLIRKDGVASPRCGTKYLAAVRNHLGEVIKPLDEVVNEWAAENATHGFLTFEMTGLGEHAILLTYTKQLSSRQQLIMERYGREISQRVARMQKHDSEQEERTAEQNEKAEMERSRLVAIGEAYEKRLKGIKAMKDGEEKKMLARELERGGMHPEKLFASLVTICAQGGEIAKFAQSLADGLGIGGLVRAEVSGVKSE